MISEDAYVDFLVKYDLTQSQVLLLYLLYKNRVDLIRKYKEKFPTDSGTMIEEYFIKDLIRKEFLIENPTTGAIKLGEKFYLAFIDKHEACEHVFSVYPTHITKDGVDLPLSAMDRNVFANLYDTYIRSSIHEHLEVIKDIEYAKQNNLLNIGIEKFLKSKYWLILRPKRIEGKLKETIFLKADNEY